MPLTHASLLLYERYRGDSDIWTRTPEGKNDPAGADGWFLIDELIMNLRAAATGQASASFIATLSERIQQEAPDPSVASELRRIAAVSSTW